MDRTIVGADVWVDDQDKALDFYVGTLGMEDPARYLVLCPLTVAPLRNDELARARSLQAEGVLGTTLLSVGDAQAMFEALVERAVTVTQPVMDHDYGREFHLAHPFANQVRISQMAPI